MPIEQEIEIEEVEEAIYKVKRGKAPGEDKVTADIITALPEVILQELRLTAGTRTETVENKYYYAHIQKNRPQGLKALGKLR